MNKYQKLLASILSGEDDINDLVNYKNAFVLTAEKIISEKHNLSMSEIQAFLKICLNYYNYSENGSVLIPDRMYDECMSYYTSSGNDIIVFSDDVKQTKKQWSTIAHKHPGLVGTVGKIYTYDELKKWHDVTPTSNFILSPKYDGVSCVIEIVDGEIKTAATRYNGREGQDITDLIKHAMYEGNVDDVVDGFYKCEIAISSKNFEELIKKNKYANRRSATSGIINTPKNIKYGKYLSIIPLLYFNKFDDDDIDMSYITPCSEDVVVFSPRDLLDSVEKHLEYIRHKDFPFRVDGVIITPIFSVPFINEGDLYTKSIAYKVNTAEAPTKIKYGYMSVGRLGMVTPMVKVEPVEVNETIVTDITLGSYANYLKLALNNNEEVIVYAAGDVIPQIKLPPMRMNMYNEEELDIPRICPYCNSKLTRVSVEYMCDNQECSRVNSGKIANFAIKLGFMGFEDRAFIVLYENNIVTTLKDLILLPQKRSQLEKVEGFGTKSIDNLFAEVEKLTTRPITASKFLGALAIPNISEKKCGRILEIIEMDFIMSRSANEISNYASVAQGIGRATAEMFAKYIVRDRELINFLLQNLNIIDDTNYIGTVVFTGFRSAEHEKKLNALGYTVGNAITSSTVALVYGSDSSRSKKYIDALKKGIPMYTYSELDEFIDSLK